jgi:hypothetical protein
MRLPLNSRYGRYSRIASAAQFFIEGDPHEALVIHKIHGCVEEYRIARERGDAARIRKVLPSIVFTFREIQNWREDSWSRDYLSTMLRTRTVVFAGYSAADPVLHDTFRTVYEEMARQQHTTRSVGPAVPKNAGKNARAFFFDLEEKRDFHGLAVLHAAGMAAGDPADDPTDHPNLITYFRDAEPHLFPTADEAFIWLHHLTVRELQARVLPAELPRLAYQLFGHPAAPADVDAIVQEFTRLREAEHRQARAFELGERKRWSGTVRTGFHRLTDWTQKFLMRLMRQYQLAESVVRYGNERFALKETFALPWYRPLNEHPQWAAWAVVLELAIRRAAAEQLGQRRAAVRAAPHIEVEDQVAPTVLYRTTRWRSPNDGPSARRSITIALRLMKVWQQSLPARRFAALPPVWWEVPPQPLAWWRERDSARPDETPRALMLWDCATGVTAAADILSGRRVNPAA